MTYLTYEKGSVVTLEATWASAVADLRLTIRVGATEIVKGFADVVEDSPSSYHYNYVTDTAGPVYYLFEALSPGLGTVEGAFLVDTNQATEAGVTDPADLRTLIPRVRRALDGPQALNELSAFSTFTDSQVLAAIADGVSNFLLFGGQAAHGFTLIATARDPFYLAPSAWSINPILDEQTTSAIVAQVALDVFFAQVKTLKVHETIADEGSSWDYDLSASLVRDQLKALQDTRDRAIASLLDGDTPLDSYVDFLSSKDSRARLHILHDWIGPPEF